MLITRLALCAKGERDEPTHLCVCSQATCELLRPLSINCRPKLFSLQSRTCVPLARFQKGWRIERMKQLHRLTIILAFLFLLAGTKVLRSQLETMATLIQSAPAQMPPAAGN